MKQNPDILLLEKHNDPIQLCYKTILEDENLL